MEDLFIDLEKSTNSTETNREDRALEDDTVEKDEKSREKRSADPYVLEVPAIFQVKSGKSDFFSFISLNSFPSVCYNNI